MLLEITFDIAGIHKAANDVLQFTKPLQTRVFLFTAPMGTGKTTFISALCMALGVTQSISSPTFSIINEYTDRNMQPAFHIDAYRLRDETEAIHAGVEDCLLSGNYCFVEWPEIIKGILPEDCLQVQMEMTSNNKRKLTLK